MLCPATFPNNNKIHRESLSTVIFLHCYLPTFTCCLAAVKLPPRQRTAIRVNTSPNLGNNTVMINVYLKILTSIVIMQLNTVIQKIYKQEFFVFTKYRNVYAMINLSQGFCLDKWKKKISNARRSKHIEILSSTERLSWI